MLIPPLPPAERSRFAIKSLETVIVSHNYELKQGGTFETAKADTLIAAIFIPHGIQPSVCKRCMDLLCFNI